MDALTEAEEMILAVTDGGFGKRTSSHEYRVAGRGGQGIAGITLSKRTGHAVVATFPVRAGDRDAGDRWRPAHPHRGRRRARPPAAKAWASR